MLLVVVVVVVVVVVDASSGGTTTTTNLGFVSSLVGSVCPAVGTVVGGQYYRC
jgi:hypothetical protein